MSGAAGAHDLRELLRAALDRGLVTREQAERLVSDGRVPVARHEVDPDLPHRVGTAPAAFSTCTEVERPFRVVFDVSGYYRSLGVHWTAGKRELREGYQAVDGQSSEWLTYALSQLLDPVVRRQYDAMPPGSIFYDKYVAEEVQRQFKARMAVKTLDLGGDEARARAEATAEGWATDTPVEEQVDDLSRNCDDQGAPPQIETPPDPFPWGHYLWRSRGAEPDRLADWQRLVVMAASERGIRATIAVGACGRTPHRTVVARVGRVVVAYLNDDHEPSPEVAGLAADSIAEAMAS